MVATRATRVACARANFTFGLTPVSRRPYKDEKRANFTFGLPPFCKTYEELSLVCFLFFVDHLVLTG